VIPAMDHIDRHLASTTCDDSYKPSIQAAVAMGKKFLNKYYSYTDHSELYCIAMSKILFFFIYFNFDFIPPLAVLHPSHKLAYFAQAGWPDEWCATAEEIVQGEFERAYADIEVADSNETVYVHCLIYSLKFYSYFVCNLLGSRC
jgi:hypothetical protein